MILIRVSGIARGLLGCLIAILPVFQHAYGEFRCESFVSYKVKLSHAEEKTPAVKKDGEAEQTPAPENVENEIGFALVEAVGSDEKAARSGLVRNINRTRGKAREACHKRFEDSAGCIASKLDASAATMRTLDFAARAALQNAITADCSVSRGSCQEPVASDPVCSEVVKPAAETPAAEGKKEEKKGKKK